MIKWLRELVSGNDGDPSVSELGFLLAVLTLCFCTIYTAVFSDGATMLAIAGVLAGQTGTTKVWKAVSDNSVLKAKENPDPVPAVPTKPSEQNVTINTGDQNV